MSNTNPAPVVAEVQGILDKIVPFLPPLVRRIPWKFRQPVYLGLPVAATIFDSVAPGLHVSGLAIGIVNVAAIAVEGVLAASNPTA